MSMLPVVLACAAVLSIAYRVYGPVLARLLQLDPNRRTPAVEMADGVDYEPIEPKFLISQHFSAIAAAGPIVGPILAGIYFGWVPALLWILVGAIFIGGVHDMTSLVASVRHKARSIAEVVRDNMTRRSYALFLTFIWIALVYIVVAFTDVTARSFIGAQTLENGDVVSGGGIATSSLLYLALPLIMGLLLRYTKLSLGMATVIFLPLVGFTIWIGQKMPLDLGSLLGVSPDTAVKIWDVFLLAYCFLAALIPVWLLLQPRGHLGGYFLFIALIGGSLGLVFGGKSIQYPAFTGWSHEKGGALFPMLFITIACGACSGFHSLIASGTTSKQLKNEMDAKPIGYGTMLLEGMVAIISLATVMMLATNSPLLTSPKPNYIYANGIGSFMSVLGVPMVFAVTFGLMAFTTFVYDTLDVCTRLGRFIIQELTGWQDAKGRWVATGLTAAVPLMFVMRTATDASGKAIPVWQMFWALFGASNQLLAALTLLGVTVWLWKTYSAKWVLVLVGIPMVWMYAVSVLALLTMVRSSFAQGVPVDPVPWVALILVLLAAMMAVEAYKSLRTSRPAPPAPLEAEPLPAAT